MKIDQEITAKITSCKSFLLVSHVRPDADAAGSVLGLGLALMKAGNQSQMVLLDGSSKFDYLPGSEWITNKPGEAFEMAIVLDCSDPERVGGVLDGYGQPDLVIDHHKTNLEFGKINVVEPEQVATAAILYDRLPAWGLTIDPDIATCLLSGIVGDTIGFRTSNVEAAVLRKAAELMDLGADLAKVYHEELINKSFEAVRYWGAGISRLMRDGRIIWTSLTLADKQEIGYAGNDDADLVNVLSSIKDADIALIFVQQPGNVVKVSWRAKPGIDVSGVAFEFGGGGHAAAAGAELEGTLDTVQEQVINRTKQLLKSTMLEA